MKLLNQRWIYRLILIVLIIVGTVACASYPSDPRSPQVGDDTYSVEEDGFLAVPPEEGILINDKPREGTRNILTQVGDMETNGGGKVVLAEDGSFSYEPKANFFGADQLSYTVQNEKGKESSGVLKFQVTPLNDSPLAENDEIAISNNQVENIDVLANDKDPDGDQIRVVEVNDLSNGNAEIAADGSHIIFSPQANHMGSVSFSYTIADAAGEQASAGVLLTSGNNILEPDTITVAEDSFITVPYGDLLANDQVDASSDIQFGEAQNGTVEPDGNRAVTYTPNPDFSGTDTFTYTVETDGGVMASTVVTVTVTPSSDAPTISDIVDQSTLMSTMIGPILFTVEDLDTPLANLTITTQISQATPPNLVLPANIRIVGTNENRALWITPTANLVGTATITVVVSDGEAQSSDSFQLTVRTPTQAPTITPIDDQTTAVNQTTRPIGFMVNDDQTPPQNLIVSATSSNQRLVPNVNITLGGAVANRSIVLQPAPQQTGVTTITITVRDGAGPDALSGQTSFRLRVGAEPPQFSDVGPQRVMALNTPLTIPFTVQDPDTPVADLSVTATSENPALVPNDGTHLSIGGGGDPSGRRSVTVTPATNQTGSVRIEISASDGINISNLRLNLQVGNNAPVISPIPDTSLSTEQEGVVPVRVTDETPANALRYNVRISSTAPGVIGAITFEYNAAGEYMELHLLPPHQAGTANLTVIVTDGGGLAAQTQFQVTVGGFSTDTDSDDDRATFQTGGKHSLLSQGDSINNQVQHFRTSEDTPLTIPTANGLLAKDGNAGLSTLRVTSISLQNTFYDGEVKMAPDGSFRYTPPKNFNGQDHFLYTMDGADGAVSVGKAAVTVTGRNDRPLATNDLYATLAGETLVINAVRGVLANDCDAEEHSLTVLPQHNSRLRLKADGSFTYRPAVGFVGKQRFSYVVTDGRRKATADLTLVVTHNLAPIAKPDNYQVHAGQVLSRVAGKGLLTNDQDPEGRALKIAVTGVFDTLFGGEVNIGPKGEFTYSPPANFNGFDSFIYTASDGTYWVNGRAEISVTP